MKDEKTAPPAEEETKASETTDDKVQDTETEKTPPTDATETVAEPAKKQAWYTKVITREAAEKREAKREAELYKRQNADLLAALADKGTDPSKPKTENTLTQTEVDRRADEKATAILFNRECDKVAEQGHEEFNDFGESLTVLQSFGNNYQALLPMVVEMPDAHKVLYHLGKNPDEAEQLLSLPPTKMAMRLAKLENELAKGKTISNAPAPIKPIAAKSKASFDPNDPNCDRDEWSKWREKNRRKR